MYFDVRRWQGAATILGGCVLGWLGCASAPMQSAKPRAETTSPQVHVANESAPPSMRTRRTTPSLLPARKERRVAPQGASTSARLDPQHAAQILRDRVPGLRGCYDRALTRTAKLRRPTAVETTMALTLAPSGRVRHVRWKPSPDRDTTSCMTRLVRRWKFPPIARGQTIVIEQPIALTPRV